jgi:hypothetical protein
MSETKPTLSPMSEIDTLVETWFFQTFHGSAVARSTETWNIVHAAKEDLKRRLAASAASAPEA